jgi:hypothetical protein
VDDFPPGQVHDDEAVQDLEPQDDDGEEIARPGLMEMVEDQGVRGSTVWMIDICCLSDILFGMSAHAETLTDFLRQPKPILKKLAKEDVVLRRRGDVALRLSLDTRASAVSSGTEIAASLLADLVSVPHVPEFLARLLADRFPWTKFLSQKDQQEFLGEFIETVRACASVGTSAALDDVIAAWKSTATICSDPKLAAELKRSLPGTNSKVPRP